MRDIARNSCGELLQFFGTTKGVVGAVNEQTWHRKSRQMLNTQLVGLAGRMQRIRDKHQRGGGQWCTDLVASGHRHRAHSATH